MSQAGPSGELSINLHRSERHSFEGVLFEQVCGLYRVVLAEHRGSIGARTPPETPRFETMTNRCSPRDDAPPDSGGQQLPLKPRSYKTPSTPGATSPKHERPMSPMPLLRLRSHTNNFELSFGPEDPLAARIGLYTSEFRAEQADKDTSQNLNYSSSSDGSVWKGRSPEAVSDRSPAALRGTYSPRKAGAASGSRMMGSTQSLVSVGPRLAKVWADMEPMKEVGRVSHIDMISFTYIRNSSDIVSKSRSMDSLPGFESTWQSFVKHPDGITSSVWLLLMCCCVSYDVITWPLFIFDIATNTIVSEALNFGSVVFWTMDIPSSIFTGFHSEGKIEMRLHKTFKAYAREWMAFDVALVSVDWIAIGLDRAGDTSGVGDASGIVQIGRLARIARFLRLVRLVRLLKLADAVRWFMDSVHSQIVTSYIKISLSLSLILTLNHYLACGWFGLGCGQTTMDTWVEQFGADCNDRVFVYLVAMHWSLTQFAPATQDISPTNHSERSYALLVVVVALLTFSSFLSTITQTVTELRARNEVRFKERSQLRRYMLTKRISGSLSHRLWMFCRDRQARRHRQICEGDVAIFAEIPESLQVTLHMEVFKPVLEMHPLFELHWQWNSNAVTMLCHKGMREKPTTASEEVFLESLEARSIYFITAGHLDYTIKVQNEAREVKVRTDSTPVIVAEPALWLVWRFLGRLQAVTPCDIVALDVRPFHSSAQEAVGTTTQEAVEALRRYAVDFQKDLDEIVKTEVEVVNTGCQSQTFTSDHPLPAVTDLFFDRAKALRRAREAHGFPEDEPARNKVAQLFRSGSRPIPMRGTMYSSNNSNSATQ